MSVMWRMLLSSDMSFLQVLMDFYGKNNEPCPFDTLDVCLNPARKENSNLWAVLMRAEEKLFRQDEAARRSLHVAMSPAMQSLMMSTGLIQSLAQGPGILLPGLANPGIMPGTIPNFCRTPSFSSTLPDPFSTQTQAVWAGPWIRAPCYLSVAPTATTLSPG